MSSYNRVNVAKYLHGDTARACKLQTRAIGEAWLTVRANPLFVSLNL
jgi:hypothetical protein